MQAQTIGKMANDIVSVNEVQGEVIFYQPDNTMRLEVRLEDETVWLTQQQMVTLFQSSKANVSEHIRNIYDQGELEQEATVRNFRTVRKEGNRMVNRTKGVLCFVNGQIGRLRSICYEDMHSISR